MTPKTSAMLQLQNSFSVWSEITLSTLQVVHHMIRRGHHDHGVLLISPLSSFSHSYITSKSLIYLEQVRTMNRKRNQQSVASLLSRYIDRLIGL